MTSMLRRAMLYLGLGPDDEYDDYDAVDEPRPAPSRPAASSRYPAAGSGPTREPDYDTPPEHAGHTSSVRTIGTAPVRPQPSGASGDPGARPQTAVVRPLQPMASAKPHVVAPTSFNHAQEVADKLKVNQPVIVNLQNVERDLSRRIIDFASGLCYGIGGTMERVANQVFLLTPSNVEVSAEERRRLEEHGYES
ncbi:MAG: cell division protein SepF [Acidimicrobiia bacterium]|jgi:cell division inhibitor SepF